MTKNLLFFDGCFDKNRIKSLISWSLVHCGGNITIKLVENLKNLGYTYATEAGISLGIDDLKIPPTKKNIITQAEKEIHTTQINYKHEYLTGIEKFQQLIDTWHRTSERLKHNVIQYFKATDILNPVYMMAFSGARGNISQVRQLVGMRGLMSDPQGQILDFPIKSNFREGLTLTEYIISCYGARKGLVDTALKTANSGYLTRRLVDVSHHIIVCEFDCKTTRGIIIKDIIENKKVTLPLQTRLIGRILAENIYDTRNIESSSAKLNTRSLFNKQNKKRNTLTLRKTTVPIGREISFSSEKSLRLEKKTLAKIFRGKPSSFKVVSLLSALFFETNAQLHLSKVQRNRIRLYALFVEKTNKNSSYLKDFPHLFFLNSKYESRIYKKNTDFSNQVDITVSETLSLPNVSYTHFNLQEFLLRVHYTQSLKTQVVAQKNDEISPQLATKIATLQKKVLVRSPLTCEIKNSICQLCYGWSLAYGKLVSLGEAVGVIAAQSIGEPGTQLTMRTFHTGGVFSGDVMSEITSPCNGIVSYPNSFPGMLIRTPHGKIAFLTKVRGKFNIYPTQNKYAIVPSQDSENALEFQIPALTILFSRNHEYVHKTQIIAEFSAISQNRNQRIKSKYDLKSEIEGEIIFQEGASYIERIKRDKEEPKKDKYISCTTLNIGSVWILSTKMYKQRIPTDIIPQPGDLVDQYSIFGQYEMMSLYNGFMTGLTKKSKTSSNLKNTLFLQQNSQSSFDKNRRQENHNLPFNLKKSKLRFNVPLKASNYSYYKKVKNISDLNNLFSTKVFLNQTHISLPFRHIQYKKIGYFFSFSTSNRSKLYFDRFFISNSLQQQFHNSTTLKTHFYFQSFPKVSQTQTGGSLIFDPFYVHEKKYFGEIFCIPEEIYIFNSINSIFFSLNVDSPREALTLKNNGKKKYFKWNTKDSSLIFYKNLQGKIVPFYSFLSGHTEIDSLYEPKKAYKVKYSENKETTLNIQSLKKNQVKSKNTKKDFFKLPILNSVPNQEYTNGKFNKRKQKIQNLKNLKISNNKTIIRNNIQVLNPYYYTFQSTILGFQKNPKFIFSHFKQNKKIKLRIIQKNYLSLLQSQFPFKKNNYSLSKYTNETWISRTFGSKATPRVKGSHEGKKVASLQVLLVQQNQSEKNYSKVKNRDFKSKSSKPILLPFSKKKIKLKSGWIYFPRNFSQVICRHKSIIKPSAECFDNIVFDQYPVFVECVPIEKFSVQNNKNIFQKTHILKQMLSIKDIYLKFKANTLDLEVKNKPEIISSFASYETSKDWKSADLKAKRVYLENLFSSTNYYMSLDKVFFHMCTTLFFDNGFSISQIICNKKERNISSGSFYSGLSLEKYIQSSLNLNLIRKQLNLNNTFLHTIQKLYEYKKIYFIHNPNEKFNLGTLKSLKGYKFKDEIQDVIEPKGSITQGFTSGSFKSGFFESFLFLASQFKNFSIKTSNKSISFHRNKLFFSKFFVLFRKMTSYSIPNSLRYKKLLTQEKQFTFYFFLNSQKSSDKVTHFTKLTSFNKQNKTYIFNPIPTTDFIVQSYCKDKKCKIHYFFKKKIIVELYVQVLVSRNYLLNQSRITVTSNSSTSLFSQKKNTNLKNFNMVINYYTLLYSNANICFNMVFFQKIRFPYSASSKLPNTKSFVNQAFLKQSSKKNPITPIQTQVLLSSHNSISNQEPVSVINFFSTYQGEILELYKKNFDNVNAYKLHDQNLVEAFFGSEGKKKQTYLILTDEDQVNFVISSPISKSKDEAFKSGTLGQVLLNQQNQSGSTTYSENIHDNQSNVPLKIVLGQYIEYGTKIQNNLALSESGQIIQIEKSKLTLRKAQSILFSPNGFLSVQDRDVIEKNALVLSLFYQRLKTGDIVQGIPRIEQLFEARQTHQGEILVESLHTQLEWLFYRYQLKHTPQQAARRSIEKIQQVIVQNVQNVYQSQGVRIAEKHLEIIVRQMTSKVQIIHGGETFLIAGELVDLDWIERANQGIKENETKATYKPVIRGITQKSLDTKSFISEASFQETTRILTKSAIQRKIDFLKGLKENVILGHVIPAGTGFKEKIIDSSKRKYISHFNSQLDYKKYKLYTNFTNIFLKTIVNHNTTDM